MSYTPKVWKFSGGKQEDARRWKEEFVCEMEAAGQSKHVHFSSCLTGRADDWYCKEVPYEAKPYWGQLSKLFTARWIEPLPTSTPVQATARTAGYYAVASVKYEEPPLPKPSPTDNDNSDIPEYDVFLVAARELQGSQDNYNALVALWKQAYELGQAAGGPEQAMQDDEIQELTGEAWQEGYDHGADTGLKDGYERGFSEGVAKIEEVFVGHVSLGECFAGRKLRVDVSIATDPLPLPTSPVIPPTPNKPESASDCQSGLNQNLPQNWADDPDLPQISSPKSPRDLSVLRTRDIKNPFGSLQKRPKYIQQLRPCDSQTVYLRDKASQKPTPPQDRKHRGQGHKWNMKAQTANSQGSGLDWCHDPRLSKLARALQDLGWVFPMTFG